jgi:hypothetical protein
LLPGLIHSHVPEEAACPAVSHQDKKRPGINPGFAADRLVLEVAGPTVAALASKSSTYAITTRDPVLLGDCTPGNLTFTLPTAVGSTGRQNTIQRTDASGNS